MFILQSLPPEEALNPQIAVWIIGVLLAVIASGVLFFKWAAARVATMAYNGWTKVEKIHDEGIAELKDIKTNQGKMLTKQEIHGLKLDNAIQQIKEVRYSQVTMAKLVVEVVVQEGGKEELDKLEKAILEERERLRKREEDYA
jgi:hypothetical protein